MTNNLVIKTQWEIKKSLGGYKLQDISATKWLENGCQLALSDFLTKLYWFTVQWPKPIKRKKENYFY